MLTCRELERGWGGGGGGGGGGGAVHGSWELKQNFCKSHTIQCLTLLFSHIDTCLQTQYLHHMHQHRYYQEVWTCLGLVVHDEHGIMLIFVDLSSSKVKVEYFTKKKGQLYLPCSQISRNKLVVS